MRSAAPGPAPMKCTVMARLSAGSATAQLAPPSLMRARIRRECGPAPASAAASASEGRPRSASTRSDRVAQRGAAASSSACDKGMSSIPRIAAASTRPFSPAFACEVKRLERAILLPLAGEGARSTSVEGRMREGSAWHGRPHPPLAKASGTFSRKRGRREARASKLQRPPHQGRDGLGRRSSRGSRCRWRCAASRLHHAPAHHRKRRTKRLMAAERRGLRDLHHDELAALRAVAPRSGAPASRS